MNKHSALLAGILTVGIAATPAFADWGDSPKGCSLATLHGTYAYAQTGTENGLAFTAAGRETYDGKGNITFVELYTQAGVTSTYTGTSTYSVTKDCMASSYNDTYTYFIAPDGREFYYSSNSASGIISAGREDRLSLDLLF